MTGHLSRTGLDMSTAPDWTDNNPPIGVVRPVVRSMSERELEAAVLDLAAILHWRRAHFRPAMTSRGWRTAVSGDGAGWPDLILVRPPRIVVAELKADKGRLTADQDAWLSDLAACGIATFVWRPANLDDGSILEALR